MTKEYSPFSPGKPVVRDLFVGRQEQLKRLRKNVASSTRGRIEAAFLVGERGIGKSSLAAVANYLFQRELKVLSLHIHLGGVSTLEEMVHRVFDGLLNESFHESWFDKIKEFFGGHIHEIDLFGVNVKFEATDSDLQTVVRNFTPSLRNLLQRLKGQKQGIFLILDDINGLAESSEFANWFKSLIDETATSVEPLPICILLVGLEERRQSLIDLQPSLARVFDPIEISSWSDDETVAFYDQAFSQSGVTYDDDALKHMAGFAGGLPVLAHEIGDATFSVDEDNHIDFADAEAGILVAAEIFGRKYLKPRVFDAIRSGQYHRIFKKITEKPFHFQFKRSDILPGLNEEEAKVFDNFLRRMRKLGVIVKESERGTYRFVNLLHYLFFSLEAARARSEEK